MPNVCDIQAFVKSLPSGTIHEANRAGQKVSIESRCHSGPQRPAQPFAKHQHLRLVPAAGLPDEMMGLVAPK